MAIGTRLTIAGAVLLAKALNGKPLNFTRGAFGDAVKDGGTVTPTDAEQDALTALIRERMTLPIKEYEIKDNGSMIVTVVVNNANVASDFKTSEIGLFAKDPDTGQELLYGYSYDADAGKMYSKNSAVALEYTVDLVTTISTAANVTATLKATDNIKPGTGMTRTGDTLNVNVANSTLLGAVKIGNGLHMNQESITANTAGETVLGSIKVGKGLYMDGESLMSAADDTSLLSSRLTQLEINQSNLFMKLEAENDLGMTANMLLVEDFIDRDCIDETAVPIDVIMTGNTHLKTTHDGLITGADYTVVKNGAEEPFHITDINRYVHDTRGIYYQLHPVPSEGFLLDSDTVVYRTTATIYNHAAYGPGNIGKIHKQIRTPWKGEGGDITHPTSTLDTSVDNASKFTITDDGILTSDGYFTLA